MTTYNVIDSYYTNPEHTQIYVILDDEDNHNRFSYFFYPESLDIAPVNQFLLKLYNNGDLHPRRIKALELAILSTEAKDKRNTLLAETDYLVNSDYPLSEEQKDEIRQFRQLLRDISQQSGFPENIVWPAVPDCIKDKITVEIPS